MSDRAVQHLLREHRSIEKILAELEDLLDDLASGSPWTIEHDDTFARIMLFFGQELAGHIRKEEEFLFPALESFLSRDEGPLSVLRGEHAALCAHFSRMCRAVQALDEPDRPPQTVEVFQFFGRSILQAMRDHIYKEDNLLFPLVVRSLAPERDSEVLRRMEEVARAPAGAPQAVEQAEAKSGGIL